MRDGLAERTGEYIPIDIAYQYLKFEKAVYELEFLYFYFVGFGTRLCRVLDKATSDGKPLFRYERVFLDGVIQINGNDIDNFWKQIANDGDASLNPLFSELYEGQSKSQNPVVPNMAYIELEIKYLNKSNVYAKIADLDAISKKFDIPKNKDFSNSSELFGSINKFPDKHVGNSKNNNHLYKFLEQTINDFPKISSKDIISHCFKDCGYEHRKKSSIRDDIEELGGRMDRSEGRLTNERLKSLNKMGLPSQP